MTIYALSSGPGISGVAVIRISGPDTKEVLLKLISGELPKPRVATLKKINKINTNEIIDEGIILWFPGPQSYTGEDMAEFHVHGSRSVIEALHSSISSINGCRLAEPGEFTKLAFQNNKINLLKAESIGDLISSETEIQRRQAIKMITGDNNKIYNSWRKRLLKILSYIEAKIDFPEDDLPKDIDQKIKVEANLIKTEIIKKLDDQKIGERIREGFKIAIVGPANAGKSTLLNYLSKRKVAIVSEIAGTTRDVIETHLNIDGFPVIVSDTAGIRESKDEIEREGIKLALKKAEDADLNIVLIEPKNADFAGFLRDLINDRSILVVNKSDLGIDDMILDFKKYNPIYLSLKKEKNIDELILKIKERLNKLFIRSEDILITRERHRQHLEQCVSYLENFDNKKDTEDFDKASEDLRLATRQLGMIVGKVDVEEILGSIFSDFCIGK
tara:strand:- start:12394 stop:13725 length:1332 start_codon:yes stop_codon:yes gene_type:complete